MTYPGSGGPNDTGGTGGWNDRPDYTGPLGPPQPTVGPGGPKRNTTPIIVAVIVVLLIVGGVGTYFAINAGGGKKTQAQRTGSSGSTSGSTSGPTSSTTTPLTQFTAQQTVEKYFDDINGQNETDAATLICAAKLAEWRSSIHGSTGDFTVKVTGRHPGSIVTTSSGVQVTYQIDVQSLTTSKSGTVTIRFTIIDENGPKICGEDDG